MLCVFVCVLVEVGWVGGEKVIPDKKSTIFKGSEVEKCGENWS